MILCSNSLYELEAVRRFKKQGNSEVLVIYRSMIMTSTSLTSKSRVEATWQMLLASR